MKDFSSWLSEVAKYGMENDNHRPPYVTPYDQPAPKYEIDYVAHSLAKRPLGHKYSLPDRFFGEVQWGEGPGAMKVTFGPFGGLRAVVHKQEFDLSGQSVWVCKKVVEVKDKYLEHADNLIAKLSDLLEQKDTEQFDAPSNTYEKTESLSLRLAHYLRKNTTQFILIYEGIKRVTDNEEYVIRFGCTGYGRQRQGQERLDEFQIYVRYFRDRGVLKITGNEVGGKLDKYSLQTSPSQFSEYFMPTQKDSEILDCILAFLNTY